jgi:putative flippase GtrA
MGTTVAAAHGRTAATAEQRRGPLVQLTVFAGVGGVLNVLYTGSFLALDQVWDPQLANAVALVLSTLVGTWGHRRFTFGLHDRAHTVGHQLLGVTLLVFSLAVTAVSLELLQLSAGDPSQLAEVVVLVVANLGCGLVRFATFRVAMLPREVRRRRAAA